MYTYRCIDIRCTWISFVKLATNWKVCVYMYLNPRMQMKNKWVHTTPRIVKRRRATPLFQFNNNDS